MHSSRRLGWRGFRFCTILSLLLRVLSGDRRRFTQTVCPIRIVLIQERGRRGAVPLGQRVSLCETAQ